MSMLVVQGCPKIFREKQNVGDLLVTERILVYIFWILSYSNMTNEHKIQLSL